MSVDLFSFAEAARLRDQGMVLAVAAQNCKSPGWSARAYAAIERIARRQPTLFVDDLLREFPEHPEHYNAWATPWRKAIKRKIIVPTGQTRTSADKTKRAHRYPLYRSLIYRGVQHS